MSFNTCINLSISNCEHEICIKAKIKNLIKVARGTCKQQQLFILIAYSKVGPYRTA
jgi:hypothetical protein